MKRIVSILVAVVLLMGLVAGCKAPAPTPTPTRIAAPTPTPTPMKQIELKSYSYVATTARAHEEVYMRHARELEKRTGGRVKVTVYPAEALGPYKEAYDLVRKGVADFSLTFMPSYTPGVLPLSEVIELPFGAQDKWAAIKAMEQLYDKGYLMKEWNDVKLLYFFTLDPYEIYGQKRVKQIEDLKGLTLRVVGGPITEAVKLLGAAPVSLPAGEIYLSLQKGVVDGTVGSVGALVRLKLLEVSKYLTKGLAPYMILTAGIMNKQRYDSLPPDIQKIVDELSRETQKWIVDSFGADDADAWEKAATQGMEINVFSPAERAKAIKIVAPVWDSWIKDKEAKGLPAKKVVEEFTSLVAK